MMKNRRTQLLAAVFGVPLLLLGCAEVVQVGTSVGQQMGQISQQDKEKLDRLAQQTEKAARPMTDQEEYFLGRAVAATLLGKYPLYQNPRLTQYVNQVGQSVALPSDRPLTYGGYHFAILDTEEVNALSCPGGIIFITRGMLRQVTNEDELAAILAHEVAHVNHRDGAAAIQRSRWIEVITLVGTEAARRAGSPELNKLVSLFEGSVNDVVRTLLVTGYSREQETAADAGALTYLTRVGYDPRSLAQYMERLSRGQAGRPGPGIFSTHPGINERLTQVRSMIDRNRWPPVAHQNRDQRFKEFVG